MQIVKLLIVENKKQMSYYWIINIVKTPLKCITGLKIKYKKRAKENKRKTKQNY